MRKALAQTLVMLLLAAQAWAFTGRVENVHDGDTVTVDGRRVRLHGIDAPELAQPGGERSREFLEALVLGRQVRVTPKDRDDYGRIVGVVVLPEGLDVNAEMVKAGHAWVYSKYCRGCYGLKLAQASARMRGLGLWSEPGPIPPWQWRKTHRRHK
ncbi:MAG: thermonuclease family protein [Thermodesulfobacteriota bacterium]